MQKPNSLRLFGEVTLAIIANQNMGNFFRLSIHISTNIKLYITVNIM